VAFCLLLRAACKPNSVEDGHSSRRAITDALQQPTRRFPPGTSARKHPGSTLARRAGTHSSFSGPGCRSLPIWSCSVWGLPCLLRYRRSGALLPHLFTLTFARPLGCARAVSSLWHWPYREPSRSDPGRYPAHCPAEFGLSSPETRLHRLSSGRPAARPSILTCVETGSPKPRHTPANINRPCRTNAPRNNKLHTKEKMSS
jgi:hypothetical protein